MCVQQFIPQSGSEVEAVLVEEVDITDAISLLVTILTGGSLFGLQA